MMSEDSIDCRKKAFAWWKRHVKIFNLYNVAVGIGCLATMRFFNSASVNFFMLPFLGIYLAILNAGYMTTFLLYRNRFDSTMGMKRLKLLFTTVLSLALATTVILAIYSTVSINHR